MDEKRKLIIFDRSEVFLLFIFIALIAAMMFTLGMHVGKNITYKQDGFTNEDREKIETLKSTQEESVDEMMAKKSADALPESKKDSTYNKGLQEELGRLSKGMPETATSENKLETISPNIQSENESNTSSMEKQNSSSDQIESSQESKLTEANRSSSNTNNLIGKFTIQLGSHATMKEAQDFADGFAVRGYNPIITEVKIPAKGTWYRVSLGSFDTASDTKEYIKKEESLFQGQDYIITEIK